MARKPRIAEGVGIATGTSEAVGHTSWVKREPLPDDSPFLPLIGRAVTEWARFEYALDKIIWALADLNDQLGSCITSGIEGAHTRFKIIHALAFYRNANEKILRRIDKLKGASDGPQGKRNRIVHDPWYFVSEPNRPTGYTTKSHGVKRKNKSYNIGPEEISTEYFKDVIDSVPDLLMKANQLLEDIRALSGKN